MSVEHDEALDPTYEKALSAWAEKVTGSSFDSFVEKFRMMAYE